MGYLFLRSRSASVSPSGDVSSPFYPSSLLTQLEAVTRNPTLTEKPIIPPGAETIFGTYGSGLDVVGTGYMQDIIDYAKTVSVLPTRYFDQNVAALRELRQNELTTAIPGNTQLIKASYLRDWALKNPGIKLPYSEWNRLRSQYVSQNGGDSDVPWLDMIIGSTNASILMSAPQYLDYVNQYRARTGKSNLGTLGCSKKCNCECEGVWA